MMYPVTFFAIVMTSYNVVIAGISPPTNHIAYDSLQFFNFCETDLNRSFAAKQLNIDRYKLLLPVDTLNHSSRIFPCTSVILTLSPSA